MGRKPRGALIVGAGVAGSSLAHWLLRAGWQVDLMEDGSESLPPGQHLQIRGIAAEVIERMGLTAAVRAKSTPQLPTSHVGLDGKVFARDAWAEGCSAARLRIAADDLVRILMESSKVADTFVSGDHIDAIGTSADAVHAYRHSGESRGYDVLVITDGRRSRTRALALDRQIEPVSFHGEITHLTVAGKATDGMERIRYIAPGRRSVTLLPGQNGAVHVRLLDLSRAPGKYRTPGSVDPWRGVRTVFADLGWETPSTLESVAAADVFYHESLAQVRLRGPWWHRRSVVLGDPAYGMGPVTSAGASLDLVGAYILAGELTTQDEQADAFVAYERLMRPVAAKAQAILRSRLRRSHPRTTTGARIANGRTARILSTPPSDRTHLLGREDDGLNLPSYLTFG